MNCAITLVVVMAATILIACLVEDWMYPKPELGEVPTVGIWAEDGKWRWEVRNPDGRRVAFGASTSQKIAEADASKALMAALIDNDLDGGDR